MQTFTPEQLKRAGELLGCKLDEASALKALIIQQDTGLSITRGEISIVSFAGKPTVMINKQGYLAYASRQPDYDGYESGVDEDESGEMVAWCKVYSRTRSRPTSVRIYRSEFDKHQSIWNEKPRYMLEKTAISLALRAAYPVLNGTYSDDEIDAQAVRIEPQENDIIVTPAKVETKPAFSGAVYTLIEAQKILENMTSQGMDVSIFDTAKVSASEFDKAAIDADFKRQMEARKAAAKQTKPTQEPPKESAISYPFCADCGDKRVLPSEEKRSREKYGVPLCDTCYRKRLETAIRNNQDTSAVQNLVTSAARDAPEFVCSICGKPMSKAEADAHQLFNKGKPMVCRECARPKSSTQTKAETQANLG